MAKQRTPAKVNDPRSKAAKDLRESVETVVFVFVLVVLLRMFGAQAFVIPTGSMATTLLGAHKELVCDQCGYESLINASDQVDHGIVIESGKCQNCRYRDNLLGNQKVLGGDRLLVGKFIYQGFSEPERWDVVVFNCLESMRNSSVAPVVATRSGSQGVVAYIKRLIGKPGEEISIKAGDIYVKPVGEGNSTIARKPPHVMIAERRLVYDNDFQAKDLMQFARRWQGEDWDSDADGKTFTSREGNESWLEYHHFVRPRADDHVELITDFESYNSHRNSRRQASNTPEGENWVGDLMIECRANIVEKRGKLILELGEGTRRYQCVFDLAEDRVALLQNDRQIATTASPVTGAGTWDLRFCNVDDTLALWVEENLVFDAGVVLEPPSFEEWGPQLEDLKPVRIGASQAKVTISGLKLYRDTYYTQQAGWGANDLEVLDDVYDYPESLKAKIDDWRARLINTASRGSVQKFSVEPDHYFMMGDNSPSSSDGRAWLGTHFVHRRQLVGKALVLYWPIGNWKFVR